MVRRGEEVKEQEKEEDEIEIDEEVEEIFKEKEVNKNDENFISFPTMEELSHYKWLLKTPRPPLYLTRRSLEDLRMFSLDDSWRMI
nr:hypothetical protein [Tanacetum cinerariifolium]